jgi:hypothetical protein
VPQLSPFYKKSIATISPIFSGAGLKIKIGESLVHSKKVFSTSYGCDGYQEILGTKEFNQRVISCDSSDEFIQSINNFLKIESGREEMPMPQCFDSELVYGMFSNHLKNEVFI